MPKQTQPYGTWRTPINTTLLSGDYRLYDAQWDTDSDTLIWQVRRSSGTALVAQAAGQNPHDILRDTSVGGRIMFGGGGFAAAGGVVYYAGSGGRLYSVPISGGQPRPITPAFGDVAAPTPSPNADWLAYVHSYEGRDALAVVPADGSQFPHKLLQDTDFVMHPAWHPDGTHLACVTWNHPSMPWDESQLQLLTLVDEGDTIAVTERQTIAGATGGESVFGAAFSPDGRYLAYTSDRAGWWQIYLYDLETGEHAQLTDDEAEYALPAWLQDMRTFGWSPDSSELYTLRTQGGTWSLYAIDIATGEQRPIGGLADYTHLEQLAVSAASGKIALIAGSPTTPDQILTIDPAAEQPYVREQSSTRAVSPDYLSQAQHITWASENGFEVHGLYYPPTNPRYQGDGPPPLIVHIHSGPTRQRFARYFPDVHFFTSRGFAVLEPNYRGSTGFGRDFKNALYGNYGVAEVEDAAHGAQHLVEMGRADPDKLIVMGSSSGGFSVLQSLILRPEMYRAGIAQAPVTDQFSLAANTHKFERHYNHTLLGPLPAAAPRYRERSPLQNASKIQTPIALFHGTEDRVVPPEQSAGIAAALRRNGVPHVHKVYEGEGHSFRQPATLKDYYATILEFLTQHVIYN